MALLSLCFWSASVEDPHRELRQSGILSVSSTPLQSIGEGPRSSCLFLRLLTSQWSHQGWTCGKTLRPPVAQRLSVDTVCGSDRKKTESEPFR